VSKIIKSYCGWGMAVSTDSLFPGVLTSACDHLEANGNNYCSVCGIRSAEIASNPYGVVRNGNCDCFGGCASIYSPSLDTYFIGNFNLVMSDSEDVRELNMGGLKDPNITNKLIPNALKEAGRWSLWHFTV